MSPLPAMAGDAETMMASPGMSAPDQGTPDQGADPRAQARGAVQMTSQIRSFNQDKFEALATQFPAVSKEIRDLLQLLDKGLTQVVRKLISSVEMPEPSAPPAMR